MQDNHLHSCFSYDSEEKLESYLKYSSGLIVTTEHLDLSNPYTGQDDIPDYDTYCQEIARLNKKYANRLRKGIEIGYYQPRQRDIQTYLADKSFDLKLLSVHHNGSYDYLQEEVLTLNRQYVVEDYLDRLEQAIGSVEADVLAHFDYGFRKLRLTVENLAYFEDRLVTIFQKMVARGLAFEINSKSMYLYGNEELYHYALQVLENIDGVIYSLGSDGHHLNHFQLHFDRLAKLLKTFGIEESDLLTLT